ncbi:levodione reductase domain protein [Necator americanus]|uniref:Levodione reductase domain protein n=1 Tax=Necator americanus TaxID=51031 RepID=W2SYK5_NECAM|nr:levodione reductase domain protein [Necator americanus]ETN73991.1 levodione reductase domain protein [Necator americanus]
MSRFQGKVVIVTGSSSGIGAGTAVLFAKEGAKVTITGRKKDGLAGTKKAMLEVGANEDHINVVVADVTDALGREEIVTSTIQKFGRLDILINNAGAGFENGSMKMDANTDLLEKQ